MIKGILICIAIYVDYRYGWESAHRMVAMECQKNGGFFVGKKVFRCTEVIDGKGD